MIAIEYYALKCNHMYICVYLIRKTKRQKYTFDQFSSVQLLKHEALETEFAEKQNEFKVN